MAILATGASFAKLSYRFGIRLRFSLEQQVYVNNFKNNYRNGVNKVIPLDLKKNDETVRKELLDEMDKHWQLSKPGFKHIVMLGDQISIDNDMEMLET